MSEKFHPSDLCMRKYKYGTFCRKQAKLVEHKTSMAFTSCPGHKHGRVHKFIKIFVM